MTLRRNRNQQALGNACTFETLEGRTLLSTSALGAPSALTAALTTTGIQLNWKDNDSTATGYTVLRSTNGKTYSPLTTLNSVIANSFIDTSVTSGTTYDYEVEAFNTTKTSTASNAVAATTKLSPVTGLTTTVIGPTTILLNWQDNDSSATGYNILRANDSVHFTQIAKVTSATANSYTDTSAVSGSQNQYEVVAYDAATIAAASALAAGATPLSAPSNLTATATSPTSVTLSWKDNDTSAIGYDVLRSTDGVHFTQIAKVTSAKATTYADNTAAADTSYEYEVMAFDASTTSPVSSAASVVTPLVAPSGLTAAATAPTSVQLKWKDNDPTAAGYDILRSTNGKTYSLVTLLASGSATTYTDTTAVSGTTYDYEVQASNGSNASAVSNAAAATTGLAPVSGLTAAATAPTTVQLNWTDNDNSATGYNVLRATDGIHFTQLAKVTSATATTYTDSAAAAGTQYQYEVVAFNAVATAAACAPASVTAPLAAPTSLTAAATGPTTVLLTWKNNAASATGYDILRSTDGVHFTQIGQVSSATTTSLTDTTAASAQANEYEVIAY
ncbi:MAG: hypothetical protein ABSH22_17840, partial [Tepidisphaeraceae bacterium]